MKYCTKCGRELLDEAVICPGCGCAVESNVPAVRGNEKESVLKTIANGIALFPLCWCIPMTISYFNHVRDRQPVSVGFKICSLLFVNLIAGILMLCDSD